MKILFAKLIVFSIPLLILFLIPALFLRMTGENYICIDDYIINDNRYLIGYAYNEANYIYLKSKELESQKSLSIVALGSSRILQFRDRMFRKPFYNAGYTISSISDFIPFIETNLKSTHPQVLLIALDQWMFNERWDALSDYGSASKDLKQVFVKNASKATFLSVWSDLLKGKYGFEILEQIGNSRGIKKIGLNAIVNSTGFRNDGSFYYGVQINKLLNCDSTANDYNFLDTYSRIKNGNRRFEYGNHISGPALVALNDLLMYCNSNNIYVVAIIPPFAEAVNFRLRESGKYAYMDSIFFKASELFEDNGFELWDMTNLNTYGSSDHEAIDGFHGSEVTYLKMLIYMVENGSILKDFTKLQNLKSDLNNKQSSYIIYEY